MPTLLFLSGIPGSGKSTWVKNFLLDPTRANWKVISRDDIRIFLFGKNYNQNHKDEQYITNEFNRRLIAYAKDGRDIIIDNTNVKESYIRDISQKIKYIHWEYALRIKFFPISLWKAYYRNIVREYRTGKWIPIKVINKMYKNFKKLDKTIYPQF